MKFFGLGMPELVIILLVALVIFGPKNLPKLGSALGKAVKGVRESVDSVNTELGAAKNSVDDLKENQKKDSSKSAEADAPVTATAVVEDASATDADAAETAFCSQCGAQLEADVKFCKKCGAANS